MGVREALKQARMTGQGFVARAKAAHGSLASALASGSTGGVDYGGRTLQNLAHHAEQLQHFTGYTYAIIRTIASRIAGQPFHVARVHEPGDMERMADAGLWVRRPKLWSMPNCYKGFAGDAEVITDHQIIRAIKRPNPIMVQWGLVNVTVASLELTGKAFWWFRDADGKGEEDIPEIWPLPASWVEPVHEGEKLYDRWRVRPSGMTEAIEIPGDEMVYFYYPDPSDPMAALSPLQALARSVMCDESIEESQRRAFINAVNPGLAFIVGRAAETAGIDNQSRPTLTEEQRRDILNAVKQQYRGAVNEQEPIILDGLIQDVKRITTTAREMDYLNSSQAAKNRLAQGWGVNTIVLGEIEGANRASAAVADDSFLANVVNPRIELLSQILTRFAAPRYSNKGEEIILYIEPAKSVDLEFQLKREESMITKGAMGRNEWRAMHDLPPIRITTGDSTYVNNAEIPIIPLEEDAGDPSSRTPISGQKGHRARHQKAGPYSTTWSKAIGPQGTVDVVTRVQMQNEAILRQAVSGWLGSLAQRVGSGLRDHAASGVTPGREVLEIVIDRASAAQELRDLLKPHLERMAMAGAVTEWELHAPRKGNAAARIHKGFLDVILGLPGAIADKVGDWVGYMLGLEQWDDVVETTLEQVGTAIDDAQEEGLAGLELVDAAVGKALGPEAQANRSQAIAATEAATAVGSGQELSREVLAERGIAVWKRWVTVGDARVRDSHRLASGQEVEASGQFSVGGFSCAHPGDPSLPPGERCGCRCIAVGFTRE